MNSFYDFIQYEDSFRGKHGDFSGKETALDLDKRLAFLREYAQVLSRKEGPSRPAVTPEEVLKALEKMEDATVPRVRERLQFHHMQASLKPVHSGFSGWQMYSGAKAEAGTLILADGILPPVPCAKFCFDGEERLTAFACRIYIPADYLNGAARRGCVERPLTTATGRIIELRAGIKEVLKIQIYPNGECYARIGKPDPYHHEDKLLGKVHTDDWNNLCLTLGKEDFEVCWNGAPCGKFLLTNSENPDTIFFSGGMHAVGEWKVHPIYLEQDRLRTEKFFIEEKSGGESEEPLGEVSLPFAVGGKSCKDRALILRQTFVARSGRAFLHLRSLDPCGDVFLNGRQVCHLDSFLYNKSEVTPFLQEGENLLEIRVAPRAPEVLYSWHRNRDPYVGWSCGEVLLDFLPEEHLENLRVETLDCGGGDVRAKILLEFEGLRKERQCSLNLYLAKINPEREQERLIVTFPIKNNFLKEEFVVPAELWSPENPNLYSLRAELRREGVALDDMIIETGFRTISQKNGEILLNGKRIILKGALIMQFLPPYDRIVVNHICPSMEEIIWQMCAIKAMNGNTVRMHLLGYGTNDHRYARVCDRLGVLNIWTTRLIDSLETVSWERGWLQGNAYAQQISEVVNHPSIIMWEGSNEYHANRWDIDLLFDSFCNIVRSVDTTRLLCPCSHLYYGGGLYGNKGFYYQDDGKEDQDFFPCKSSSGWKDPLVVRSAHTYEILLGYGNQWDTFRRADWASQSILLKSKEHAYIVSEFAVIGRHDDTVSECKEYVKNDSYELSDELRAFGCKLTEKEWKISQAYQALCARHILKKLRSQDADGMLWCCLSGGANDASYLKPPIDFYGYAKFAFYALREGFADTICYDDSTDVVVGRGYTVHPVLSGTQEGKKYKIRISLKTASGKTLEYKEFTEIEGKNSIIRLPEWRPIFNENGFYLFEYEVSQLD